MKHPVETVINTVPTPAMANFANRLHGGELLKLLDQVASAGSRRYARAYAVTASVNNVEYFHPIEIGDYLTITSTVVKVGRTSMTLDIVVECEGMYTGEVRISNRATFVMVAMSNQNKPIPVPQLP